MRQAPTGQIIFSHGNSFPAGTYGVLLERWQAQGHEVHAIDRFGHDPKYPVTNNWPHLIQELVDFCATLPDPGQRPRYLIGHSMGGILSIMAAARHPHLAQAVLLLDAPLLTGWRAGVLRAGKRVPMVMDKYSPGAVSQKRRQEWENPSALHQHFSSKSMFTRWHPDALKDYMAHGMQHHPSEQHPQRHMLRFDRMVETQIYNTLPDNFASWLRRHPLQVPVAFIGGTESKEIRQVGMDTTQRVTKGRVWMVPGGSHLFPLEQPDTTIALADEALAAMMRA